MPYTFFVKVIKDSIENRRKTGKFTGRQEKFQERGPIFDTGPKFNSKKIIMEQPKPNLKIIQATNNAELAVRFGRKAKSLIDTEDYQKIFNTRLREDSQAAGKWETAQGGEYYAAGVGGSITGRGADLLIIDDPHSEQDALNMASYDRVYEWYTSGPRQRLQPGGRIIVVMTRWSVADLTGKLMKAQKEPKADQWEVIEFPAILPSGKPVWPGYWKLEELEAVKASVAITKWNAQYQQNPTAEEGSIIKREWWNTWEKEELPPLTHVIQSYDTAFMKKETADYSAITTSLKTSPKNYSLSFATN